MSQDSDDLLKFGAILAIGKIISDRIQGLENRIISLNNMLVQKDQTIFRLTEDKTDF